MRVGVGRGGAGRLVVATRWWMVAVERVDGGGAKSAFSSWIDERMGDGSSSFSSFTCSGMSNAYDGVGCSCKAAATAALAVAAMMADSINSCAVGRLDVVVEVERSALMLRLRCCCSLE